MILVDTSIWVDHFRKGNAHLGELLMAAKVLCHPFVIGELACGNMKRRSQILSLLQALPESDTLHSDEYLHFLDHHRLYGLGIGFVDIHLLASARLSRAPLWTADKRLMAASMKLDVYYDDRKEA